MTFISQRQIIFKLLLTSIAHSNKYKYKYKKTKTLLIAISNTVEYLQQDSTKVYL